MFKISGAIFFHFFDQIQGFCFLLLFCRTKPTPNRPNRNRTEIYILGFGSVNLPNRVWPVRPKMAKNRTGPNRFQPQRERAYGYTPLKLYGEGSNFSPLSSPKPTPLSLTLINSLKFKLGVVKVKSKLEPKSKLATWLIRLSKNGKQV